ncbi:MAG: hypothetical protein IBX69_12590 [Anaerolineales bacterium]|nr:hypothetical protein [Anaerolineales bacterium]
MVEIFAEIRNVKYHPTLCKPLPEYDISELSTALMNRCFFLRMDDNNKLAISRWVSPKRTRSYPYSSVYDTMQYSGKKVTIIPIFKDEGQLGDRDFLQWDTISLMSLLGVYAIISYYSNAELNSPSRKKSKITNQQFDLDHIRSNLNKLMVYHLDALHWNLNQLTHVGDIGNYAIKAYRRISKELDISMHSFKNAERKVSILQKEAESFKKRSRELAAAAASREVHVINPSEKLSGKKGRITITNYVGGEYHLTVDEVWFKDENTLQLVEGKHTSSNLFPSISDIKDGFVKMILFTNLENVMIANKFYQHESVMKLTSSLNFDIQKFSKRQMELYRDIQEEARINNFKIFHT